MTKYVVYKPFQIFKGQLLPIGTYIDVDDEGRAYYNGTFICLIHSVHSQECLVGDDDRQGMKRGRLIEDIEGLIQGEPDTDLRCDRVTALWEDDIAKKYVRYNDPSNPWLWDDSYFCAKIEDLEHIKETILNAPHYDEDGNIVVDAEVKEGSEEDGADTANP